MRVAIYHAPPPGSALGRDAALWLGRDAFSGEATRAPDVVLDPIVAEPARYGFHATMRAPFRLAEGLDLDALDARLAEFCAGREPVLLPAAKIAALGPFFAVVPAAENEALSALEASVVHTFEPFRAPLTPAETERRRPHELSARQRKNLAAYGYPYVLDEFRFHMTLTGPVEETRREAVAALLAERFAEFDGAPMSVASLSIFVEVKPGDPFRVHSLHPFGSP